MKNIVIGAVLGVIASSMVQFFMTSEPKTAPFLTRPLSSAQTYSGVSEAISTSDSKPLSEQQLRRIIQEEIRANVSEQLNLLRRELAQTAVIDTDAEKQSATNSGERTAANNPTYQTVNDMVDAASIDGYFTPESIAELKIHYAELNDSQKFQIDAKLADSINNGTLEFDEALFLPVH